jgi:electron transport complex protein RnfC
LFGRPIAGALRPSEEGFVVFNVGTALAVHRAVRERQPVLDRYLTVAGIGRGQSGSAGSAALPCNVRVPIGALMSEVLFALGERPGPNLQATVGGQWMGRTLPSVVAPVGIQSACLQVLGNEQHPNIEPTACIRCARCNDVCPYDLLPMQMHAARDEVTAPKPGQVGLRARSYFARCTMCGTCDTVCPSHIPLAQRFRLAKQVLVSQARDVRHAQWADARSHAHEVRAARRKAGLVSATTPVAPISHAPLREDKVAAAVARVRARRAQRADRVTQGSDAKQSGESLLGSVEEGSPGC